MERIFDQVLLEEDLWLQLTQRGLKYIITQKLRQIETFYVETLLNGKSFSRNIRSIQGNGCYKIRYDHSQRIPFRISEQEGKTRLQLGKILSHQEGEQLHNEEYVFGNEITLTIPDSNQPETQHHHQPSCPYFSPIGRQLLPEDEQRIMDNTDADLRRILNQAQNQFLHEQGPILLKGTAGSGKTTVCIYRLLQSLTQNKIYITYTPHLKKYAEKIFFTLTVGSNIQPVKFFTFEEFCFTLISNHTRFKPHKKMTFETFKSLKFVQDNVRQHRVSPYILWEEIRGVLKQTPNPMTWAEYQKQAQCPNIAQATYDIFSKYQDYRNTYEMWDDVDLAKEANLKLLADKKAAKYQEIVVDEVQDLTNVHFQLLANSVHHPNGLFLAGDESQSIHPSKFSWEKVETILNSNPNIKQQQYYKAYRRLVENYRSPRSVFNLVKAIKQWRHEKWQEVDDVSDVITHKTEREPIQLISPQNLDHFQIDISPTDTMIVVPSETLKTEARKIFGVGSVLTITEAKGLENQNIVLYKFFEEEEVVRSLKMQQLAHHSQRFARTQTTLLNLLHVALTRAEKQVFIISEKENLYRLPPCQNFPFALTQGTQLKTILKTQQEDPKEFLIWGWKLEQAGALEQAEANYIKAGQLGQQEGYAYGNKCRGLIAKNEHRYQDAIVAFEAALNDLEEAQILQCLEECLGLLALENNQLETAKNHILSAEIPPATVINQLLTASKDEKYNTALTVILEHCPEKLEAFYKDQTTASKLSLSVKEALQFGKNNRKAVTDYARLQSQFYENKVKQNCRDKYQKLLEALPTYSDNLSEEKLSTQSAGVQELYQLKLEIKKTLQQQHKLSQKLLRQGNTFTPDQKGTQEIDQTLNEVKTLLKEHPKNWNKTINRILNHRLGDVRISFLKTPYVNEYTLSKIIQKVRKSDIEELINYLIDNQKWLPKVINQLLSKRPDPDLILKLHNRTNSEIQIQCAQYLIQGYVQEPSLSPHLLETRFEIKTKTIHSSKKRAKSINKRVTWWRQDEQGTTLFKDTHRGWLIYPSMENTEYHRKSSKCKEM